MLKQQITWWFNPPAASHQGSILFDQFAKFFMCSLVIEYCIINCCIHSLLKLNKFLKIDLLPLRAVALLTPNHLFLRRCLLVGCSPTPPPGQFIKADSYRKSWKLVQFLADQFWSQWLKLYIQCLQPRQKRLEPHHNLTVGDVVLIAADNVPWGNWPNEIVEKMLPDKEDRVRHVRVRSLSSSLTRDVKKLCLLEAKSAWPTCSSPLCLYRM